MMTIDRQSAPTSVLALNDVVDVDCNQLIQAKNVANIHQNGHARKNAFRMRIKHHNDHKGKG